MNNKKIVWLLIALVLVAVFFSLNQIVAWVLPNEYSVHKIEFEDYADVGEAYALMNELEIAEDDLRETITCSGWVFAETEENNDNKRAWLILKGRNNCYMTEELDFRISTIQWYASGWKKIQGDNHNFGIVFSTVALPPDVYEIYIYVEENDHSKGIVDTGRGFRKNGVQMESFTDVTVCDVPDVSQMETVFDHGWWNIYPQESHIRVQGWQIKEGIASDLLTYYAVFVGENGEVLSFQMASKNHRSLGDDYGRMYITSGFEGCFDYDQLPDVKGLRYIVAEYNGQWYCTKGSAYDCTEMTVE